MTDVLNLRAIRDQANDAVRALICEYGAGRLDLIDAGLTDYEARQMLRQHSARDLAPGEAVSIPSLRQGTGPAIVALVPMNDLGRRYLRHDVYLRDAALRGQIRLSATHLGWSDAGVIKVVRPINGRWRIGSAAAVAATAVKKAMAVLAEPDVHNTWPGQATLLQLGAPIQIGLALGFAPNPTGGKPAIPGIRHVLLMGLRDAVSSGQNLLAVPTL